MTLDDMIIFDPLEELQKIADDIRDLEKEE